MSMTRWWKLASLLLVAGATVTGAGLVASGRIQAVEPRPQGSAEARPASGGDVATAVVQKGKFEDLVTERGRLEPMHRESILCRIEGRTTIISPGPRGDQGQERGPRRRARLRVPPGPGRQPACRTQSAEAAFEKPPRSRGCRDRAQGDEEGILLAEQGTIRGEIKLAESELAGPGAVQRPTAPASSSRSPWPATRREGPPRRSSPNWRSTTSSTRPNAACCATGSCSSRRQLRLGAPRELHQGEEDQGAEGRAGEKPGRGARQQGPILARTRRRPTWRRRS